jgi:hypothetical protein
MMTCGDVISMKPLLEHALHIDPHYVKARLLWSTFFTASTPSTATAPTLSIHSNGLIDSPVVANDRITDTIRYTLLFLSQHWLSNACLLIPTDG